MNSKIRVLLADDHPLFREGVRTMLAGTADIEVIGVAGSGAEAVRMVVGLAPEVVLLDVSMPDIEGPEVVVECRRAGADPRFVFLTMHKYSELLRKSIALGVKGYVLKDSGPSEVIDAIRAAARGMEYLSPSVTALLMKEVREKASLGSGGGGIGALTPAQQKVLRLIASDRTSKEIASDLGLSVRTVENHRARSCQKLGLSGAHSLVKFAFEHRGEL